MARRAVIARRRRFEEIPVTGNLGSIPSSERGFAGLRLQNKQSIFFARENRIFQSHAVGFRDVQR
jgi:hypothetical protein